MILNYPCRFLLHIQTVPADIIIKGDTLSSSYNYSTFQWYNQETGMIEGATGNNYLVDESGGYYFIAVDENGCRTESETVTVVYTSSDLVANEAFEYLVTPNPNDGQFSFRVNSRPKESITLTLLNPIGQIVETRKVMVSSFNHTEKFQLKGSSKGVFVLIISSGNWNVSEKIIVN